MSFDSRWLRKRLVLDCRKRSVVCMISATLSALSQATLLGILTSLVVLDLATTRLRLCVLTAIVFNALVTLIMLAIVAGALQTDTTTSQRTELTRLESLSLLVGAAISLATLILSIYILVSAWLLFHFSAASLSRSLSASLIVTGIIIWSFTVITHIITYAALLPSISLFKEAPEEITTIGYRYPSSPPRKRFSMSFRSHVAPTTPEKAQLTDPYSPSSASLRSLKSSRPGSVSQVFGPLGSKTRLLFSQSIHGRDSESQLTRREASLEIACRGETPDTPSSPSFIYELSSSPPLTKHACPLSRLATIPGSRPVSPAKPLDGPFNNCDAPPESPPLPGSPTFSRAHSPTSPYSTSPVHDLPFPPMIGEVAFQSHIHPLFRSGSPCPPPVVVSPNTSVTTLPYFGPRRQNSANQSHRATPELDPELEQLEGVPNFSRPGVASRNEVCMMNMI